MMLKKLLFGREENASRRAYVWNMVSSLIFSLQSALFLLVVTRAGGTEEAGRFMIYFTVAQTLSAVGGYSIREFQVSDLREEYPFSAYYTTRWVTCLAMLVLAGGYSILKGLSSADFAALGGLVSYRFIECMEDVYHGHVQRKGRFDVTSLSMSLRMALSSLAFCACYLMTKNLALSTGILALASLAAYAVLILPLKQAFPEMRPGRSFPSVPKILAACFPIFAGMFLYSYLINAPRYTIDDLLPKDAQTIYGVLFMPVFAVNLLSAFIYRPQLVSLSALWGTKDLAGFRKAALRQLVIIAGLTAAMVTGGLLIGLRLLELVYGVSLEEYRLTFGLLLLFGGFTAAAFYLNTLLTIMRKQHFILIGYGSAFLVHLLATAALVKSHGIAGAGLAYGAIMGFLFLFDATAVTVLARKAAKMPRKEDLP